MIKDMTDYETQMLQTQLPTGSVLELLGISAATILFALIASAVISLLFLGLMIANMVRTWKVQKAIFQMQHDIHEMNERSKNRPAATSQAVQPAQTTQEQIAS